MQNFITGAGGYLQNYINGYAGLKYTDEGFTMRPCVPPHGVTGMTLRGLTLASSRFRVHYNETVFVATLVEGAPCTIGKQGGGQAAKMQAGHPVALEWSQGDIFEVIANS